ncbi:condensation domain-containing protein [Flavobacterium magnesitis]|uniref:condensation domain-containing protein n=1 Tax=Flavobacterium magnesitis TaxID=3138077 RepID=UPI0035901127
MKRKLLFGERMLLGDGTEPFNTVIPFRLKGRFVLKDVEHALNVLQAKHPWLNAVIKYDENKAPWFEVTERKIIIPIRTVHRKGEEHWQEESKKEWHTVFDSKENPLMRFVWIEGEDVSDMLFVFHHCLCDGGSAMTLLHEFLQLLDNPLVQINLENPILGIQDVVPNDILSNRRQQLKAKVIGRLAATVIKCMAIEKKGIDRKKDYLIHWKFDTETTKEIISLCKYQEVTVNTFLSAVVLQAFKKTRKKAFNKVSCPVDIRRFAPQIKDNHIFAFGLMIVVSLNKKISFEENLKLIQQAVEKKTSKLNPYLTMMVLESAHDAVKKFTKLLKFGKSSNDCMFSNLGRIQIPSEYQQFSLENVFSPSVIGPLGNTTTMVTSTFCGEMDFSFIGSEGYLPYVEALAIRDEMIKTIQQQLESLVVS